MFTKATRGTLRSVVRGSAALAAFLATTAVTSSVAYAKGLDVCTVYATTDSNVINDVKKKLDDTKLFNSVTNIDGGPGAPAAATLANCQAVLVYADSTRGFSYPAAVGDALAAYADQGGGVVVVNPYYTSYSYNNIYSANWDKYMLIENGSISYVSTSALGTTDMTHPVMRGISKIATTGSRCYVRSGVTSGTVRAAASAKIVASWSDGNAMVVVGTPNGKLRVDLNFSAYSSDAGTNGCYDPSSDASKLIANALMFVANTVKVTPQPVDFGTVPQGTLSVPMAVDVSNTGTEAVTLTGGVLAPTGVFTVAPVTYPQTLNPGEKLTLTVTALPTQPSRQTATYTITQLGTGTSPIVVNLTVLGQGPVFDIQPPTIDFGGILAGKTAQPITVTVTNVGGGYLSLNPTPSLTDNTNFGLDKLPTPLPTLIGAGGSVTFEVKFTPSAENQFSTALRVPYSINGVNSNASVTVKGSMGKPKIQVPISVVLSPVRVNQLGPDQQITVTNVGLAELNISALTFTGGDAGDFAVVSMPPLKVAPITGVSVLKIACNPKMSGLRQSTLSINSDDPATPTATIAISCKGTVANFAANPEKIDFNGTQTAGSCSTAQNVVLSNSGSDALRILSIGMTGMNPGSFKYTLPPGARAVPPMSTYTIPVQFCPVDIGAQAASLTIATDLMTGHTAQVPLTGTGTGPQVVLDQGSVDFGAVYIKTISGAKQVKITNNGDQPLVFGKSSVTPAMPAGVFTVSGLPLEGTILKKGDPAIVLNITAAPLTAIAQSGEIAINVNDQIKMGIVRIPLAVTGVQANIAVSPMMMTFPVTIIGTTSMEQTLTVTNTGAAALTGIALSVVGTNAGDFLTSGMAPAMLGNGQSATFKIFFKPTGNGARNAIIAVNANGLTAPTQVKVDGNGKLLTISCTPEEKDLGKITVGTSTTLKVVCTNSDTAPIDYVASFSDNLDDWAVDPATGTLPAASGTDQGIVSLNITFTPTGTGNRTTTMTVKTKDGLAIGTINLDGTGTMMLKPPIDGMGGCTYSGRGPAQTGTLVLLVMALGTLLLRRRRFV